MGYSRENQDNQWTPPETPSMRSSRKMGEIISMLALFGIRRQSKLDKEDYKVYASDLEKFDLLHIDLALQALCRHPRQPGESAFPEVARIIEAIKDVKRARAIPEFDHAAYMRDVRAHPERYVRVGDVIREVMDRRRAAGKPIPDMFRDSKQGDAA